MCPRATAWLLRLHRRRPRKNARQPRTSRARPNAAVRRPQRRRTTHPRFRKTRRRQRRPFQQGRKRRRPASPGQTGVSACLGAGSVCRPLAARHVRRRSRAAPLCPRARAPPSLPRLHFASHSPRRPAYGRVWNRRADSGPASQRRHGGPLQARLGGPFARGTDAAALGILHAAPFGPDCACQGQRQLDRCVLTTNVGHGVAGEGGGGPEGERDCTDDRASAFGAMGQLPGPRRCRFSPARCGGAAA